MVFCINLRKHPIKSTPLRNKLVMKFNGETTSRAPSHLHLMSYLKPPGALALLHNTPSRRVA